MKIFSHILSFEFNSIIRKKSWYITTIILSVLIIIATSTPTIIHQFDNEDTDSPEQNDMQISVLLNTKDITIQEFEKYMGIKIEEATNEKDFKEKVKSGDYEYGIKINAISDYEMYFKDKSLSNFSNKSINKALKDIQKKNYLEKKTVNYDDLLAIDNLPINAKEVVLGTDGVNNFPVTYLLIFIIYFLVLFYGQMVSTSVAKEKSDRTMELLITSTTPTKLMYGKVLGGGAAGLLQFSIFGLVAALSFKLNMSSYPSEVKQMIKFTPNLAMMFIIFILLGYLLYLFIYAMLGATVSKLEDLNQAVLPITIIMVISFIATTSSMQFPDSMVLKIASYVPFSAPLAMFTRLSLYSVKTIEVIISIIILVTTTVLFGFISTKIYRSATLNYGNKMKLSKVFKIIFRKE